MKFPKPQPCFVGERLSFFPSFAHLVLTRSALYSPLTLSSIPDTVYLPHTMPKSALSQLSLSPLDRQVSPTLAHFNRLAGTQSGQDKLLMTYSCERSFSPAGGGFVEIQLPETASRAGRGTDEAFVGPCRRCARRHRHPQFEALGYQGQERSCDEGGEASCGGFRREGAVRFLPFCLSCAHTNELPASRYRLFGVFPMIQWAQSLNDEEAQKGKDKVVLRLEKLQAWSMLIYYPLEHICTPLPFLS